MRLPAMPTLAPASEWLILFQLNGSALPAKQSIALLSLLLAVALQARVESGRIVGTVLDPNGAVVPAAQVAITAKATNQTTSIQTNDSGSYVVTGLNPETTAVNQVEVVIGQSARSYLAAVTSSASAPTIFPARRSAVSQGASLLFNLMVSTSRAITRAARPCKLPSTRYKSVS